ncbi:unnamed protein product [Callosobruchus maculatus]|uniref:UDP-glucuronosyltransferase n=1 Tax=Callosobruchus maculatus TaxID=64391 RepID=A0A653CXE0_CALMS|nr:unnamed protein product [Callosobruchus maculatus]
MSAALLPTVTLLYHIFPFLFQVTLVTTDPINDPRLTNLTEISIREAYKLWRPMYKDMTSLHDHTKVTQIMAPVLESVQELFIKSKEVRALMNNETTFDLVMVEALFPQLLIFGELFQCPTVILMSLGGSDRIHRGLGNSIHPIVHPDIMLPFFRDLGFKERLTSVLSFLHLRFKAFLQGRTKRTDFLKKYFGKNAPDVSQLIDKVSMTFFNSHPALDGARAVGPNTINFGGMVHIREPQPLPKDLEEFLNTSKEGVVYFSLGSNVKSADLGQDKFEAIAQALGELPYKVLWKYESDDIPQKPKNIKFVKWTPQQDVLRHPNVKAFVTQVGLQSLEEAIYYHVPIVMLPFYGDQEQNAKKAEYKKIGKAIYHMQNGLTKDELKSAIIEVIEDPSYRQNMKSLADIMLDEPMSGVEKVVWWSEYVIRHKGARHLRNPVLDIPLYQYLMLDIIAFFILIIAVFSVLVLKVLKILKHLVSGYIKFKSE